MSDLILCTTEDGRSQIKLRAQEQTVWLTQLEKDALLHYIDTREEHHRTRMFQDEYRDFLEKY